MSRKSVVVVGAGKIGVMITRLLVSSGDYEVTLVDKSEAQLAHAPEHEFCHKRALDVADTELFVSLQEP